MKPIFALIDCDNFFVSCERLFRPDLEDRPVVVLSSNDGCVISRSAEAKKLGIAMATPAFKYRQLFREQAVVQFSANFELYGDLSERITRLCIGITPRTELYSIDESFLDLSQLDITNYKEWGELLGKRVLREVGIPVSIGIAGSKTLAKLAGDHAKKAPSLKGVLDLFSLSCQERAAYLLATPISDVWGVGRRLSPKLKAESVFNALDLAQMRPQRARQLMGIHGRQLVAELSGQSCRPLEAFGKVRQTVMSGRTFGEDTNKFEVIEAAIARLGARAALCLRREGLAACSASLSLSTNRQKPSYHNEHQIINFAAPTADTGRITAELIRSAFKIFNPLFLYHRANVLLYDLVSQQALQPDLFGAIDPSAIQTAEARLRAFDDINSRYGKRTIRYAAEDLSRVWEPKQQLRSPRYTTSWHELPIVQISAMESALR